MIVNATHLGERLNGIGVYVLNLLREWSKSSPSLRFEVHLHSSARIHLADVSFPPGFDLHWVDASTFADTDNARRLLYANQLARGRPHELIFNPSQLEMTFSGARQIVTVHDLIPLQSGHSAHRNQRLFLRHLAGYALKRAVSIVTGSEATAHALQREYGLPADRIRVIPYGVRTLSPDGSTGHSRRSKYLLYVGRMAPHRNLERLIEAFHRIRGRVVHDLVLAGAADAGWETDCDRTRVSTLGYVSDGELADLYRGASALVFPSIAEGYGLPVVEAMAHGCPVITSARGGLPEACGAAAQMVDPESAGSIADGILSVLTDESLQKRLSTAGRLRASELSWERCATRHLELFEEALARA